MGEARTDMRRKRPVVALIDGKVVDRFSSITRASQILGINPGNIYGAVMNGTCAGGYHFRFIDENDVIVPLPPSRSPKALVVDIDGLRFYSVDCPDKTSCRGCDIFLEWPPRNLGQLPRCYDESVGKHRVVALCQSRRLIWKKQ